MEIKKVVVFDHYGPISECRQEFLEQLLPELIDTYDLKTALDVGCGAGFFSNCLAKMGMNVASLDARTENIAEAKKRYPDITFYVYNIEDPKVLELGSMDMVLCFGLLYHLENPFRAIRNLYALTQKLLVIESRIAPYQLSVAALVDEVHGEDQGLHYTAFVPSEACLVKMLYRAGFVAVYKPQKLPDQQEFKESWGRSTRRTILVASKVRLVSPQLGQLPEARDLSQENLCQKKWGYQVERILQKWENQVERTFHLILRFLRKPLRAKLQTLKNLKSRWHS